MLKDMCSRRVKATPIALFIGLSIGACRDNDEIVTSPDAPQSELVAFTKSASMVDADGIATVLLIARVPSNVASTSRRVTFTSEFGSFAANGANQMVVPADSAGVAIAILTSPLEPRLSVVRAYAGQAVMLDTVRFVATKPDTVLVNPSKLRATIGETISVDAIVRRLNGRAPTAGTEVTFTSTAGAFGAATLSDSNGKSVAQFCVCNSTSAPGPIVISAMTRKPSGDVVIGTATVVVVPKEATP